MTGKGAYI